MEDPGGGGELVAVDLVGGPLDGERHEMPLGEAVGADAGAYLIVNGPKALSAFPSAEQCVGTSMSTQFAAPST